MNNLINNLKDSASNESFAIPFQLAASNERLDEIEYECWISFVNLPTAMK